MTIFCVSSRRTADGFQRRTYSAEEVDAIAAYCFELDRCFLIPIEQVANRPSIALRIEPCLTINAEASTGQTTLISALHFDGTKGP
jgi:hypothetical protein